jgi:hypothetical protein
VRATIRRVLLEPAYALEERFRDDLSAQAILISTQINNTFTFDSDLEWNDSIDHTYERNYLDRIHIYALSIITKRPIIVAGHESVGFAMSGNDAKSNIPGIYISHLPTTHKSTSSEYLEPIALGFRGSHYTPIVGENSSAETFIPLTLHNSDTVLFHYADNQNADPTSHPNLRVFHIGNTPVAQIRTPPTSQATKEFYALFPDELSNTRPAPTVVPSKMAQDRPKVKESRSASEFKNWSSPGNVHGPAQAGHEAGQSKREDFMEVRSRSPSHAKESTGRRKGENERQLALRGSSRDDERSSSSRSSSRTKPTVQVSGAKRRRDPQDERGRIHGSGSDHRPRQISTRRQEENERKCPVVKKNASIRPPYEWTKREDKEDHEYERRRHQY